MEVLSTNLIFRFVILWRKVLQTTLTSKKSIEDLKTVMMMFLKYKLQKKKSAMIVTHSMELMKILLTYSLMVMATLKIAWDDLVAQAMLEVTVGQMDGTTNRL